MKHNLAATLLGGNFCAALLFLQSTGPTTAQSIMNYDGDWRAKVTCSESTHGRPALDYTVRIEIQDGKINKTFQNSQNSLDTKNVWTGKVENSQIILNIIGSNNKGEKWNYALKSNSMTNNTINFTGPFYDARGNVSRTCGMTLTALNATNAPKPEAQNQATQRAEQENARLKQELAAKQQALTSAPAPAPVNISDLEQRIRQESKAEIDAQRQATQRAEQEVARLNQAMTAKEPSVVTASELAPAQKLQTPPHNPREQHVSSEERQKTAKQNSEQTSIQAELSITLKEFYLELGKAKLLGKARIALSGTEQLVATGEFNLKGFEQLQSQATATSDGAFKELLTLLKDYGEINHDNIIWRISFDENKFTINDLDLTAVLGTEINRLGSPIGKFVRTGKEIISLVPKGSAAQIGVSVNGNLDIIDQCFAVYAKEVCDERISPTISTSLTSRRSIEDTSDLVGKIVIHLVGFDQIQKILSESRSGQQLTPALQSLKGFAETNGDATTWHVEFRDAQVQVHGQVISGENRRRNQIRDANQLGIGAHPH